MILSTGWQVEVIDMLEEFARFRAFCEDGREYKITTYYELKRKGRVVVRIGPIYKTTEGHDVKKIKDGVFWIEDLDIPISSYDPKAL